MDNETTTPRRPGKDDPETAQERRHKEAGSPLPTHDASGAVDRKQRAMGLAMIEITPLVWVQIAQTIAIVYLLFKTQREKTQ